MNIQTKVYNSINDYLEHVVKEKEIKYTEYAFNMISHYITNLFDKISETEKFNQFINEIYYYFNSSPGLESACYKYEGVEVFYNKRTKRSKIVLRIELDDIGISRKEIDPKRLMEHFLNIGWKLKIEHLHLDIPFGIETSSLGKLFDNDNMIQMELYEEPSGKIASGTWGTAPAEIIIMNNKNNRTKVLTLLEKMRSENVSEPFKKKIVPDDNKLKLSPTNTPNGIIPPAREKVRLISFYHKETGKNYDYTYVLNSGVTISKLIVKSHIGIMINSWEGDNAAKEPRKGFIELSNQDLGFNVPIFENKKRGEFYITASMLTNQQTLALNNENLPTVFIQLENALNLYKSKATSPIRRAYKLIKLIEQELNIQV